MTILVSTRQQWNFYFMQLRQCGDARAQTSQRTRLMKRPLGHLGTGRARPPRCLVRWKCDSPRLFITSGKSNCRELGRDLAVSRAVPEPFLSRFSIQTDEFLGFGAQKRLKDHRQRRTCWPQHHSRPSACCTQTEVMLGPTGAPLAVIF